MVANENPVLKEHIVKESLEQLDWPLLKKHLDEIDFNESAIESVLGHLRRTSSLIMPYPNSKRESCRDAFFDAFNEYIRGTLGDSSCVLLSQDVDLLIKIEQGYRGILKLLDNSDISSLSADIRVGAYIGRAVLQYFHVIKEFNAAIRTRKDYHVVNSPLFISANKQPVSPDGIITSLVESLSSTLIMEAYKNNWLDSDKCVILPPLPRVGEDEYFKAGLTEVLAMWWRSWRRTEERRRFLGGTFEEHTAPDLPAWAPREAQHLTIYSPSEEADRFFDYAANERLNDRLMQTFAEMLIETNMTSKATGIRNSVPLLPKAFVSAEEAHAAVSLSEVLSYNIADDDERPGGLRLSEWLRGYAVLKELASDHEREESSVAELSFTITRGELTDLLKRCGFSPDAAVCFINAATLKVSSRDLFDCPLIKMADGTLMVFAPAVITANLARVLLSTIANLGNPLARKGKAFERYILSSLESKKLRAKAFKVKREGEEYQYDIVTDWGDYVFIFECKNHSLSNHQPVQAYYFDLENRSNAKQVNRLTEALRRYPDILKEQFGVDVTKKTLVPCVLNALPYSRFGKLDGVYFTDASTLKRFFQERYVHLKTPYQLDKDITFLHRVALHSLWASDQPSPEDLIRQKEEPFQLKLMLGHMELGSTGFAVGPSEIIVTHEFKRTEMNIESFCDVLGVSSKSVRKEMAAVATRVEKVKKRRDEKTESKT
jgi:hypothetical protein